MNKTNMKEETKKMDKDKRKKKLDIQRELHLLHSAGLEDVIDAFIEVVDFVNEQQTEIEELRERTQKLEERVFPKLYWSDSTHTLYSGLDKPEGYEEIDPKDISNKNNKKVKEVRLKKQGAKYYDGSGEKRFASTVGRNPGEFFYTDAERCSPLLVVDYKLTNFGCSELEKGNIFVEWEEEGSRGLFKM